MKRLYTIIVLSVSILLLNSCSKEEYFKSEDGIRKQLQGTWNLIPIPKYDLMSDGSKYVHQESWSFTESIVSMLNNGMPTSGTYSVNTSISKAEIKVDALSPALGSPARVRINTGTWQIVSLDDDFLIIANDQDGTTGLTELEFEKKH